MGFTIFDLKYRRRTNDGTESTTKNEYRIVVDFWLIVLSLHTLGSLFFCVNVKCINNINHDVTVLLKGGLTFLIGVLFSNQF